MARQRGSKRKQRYAKGGKTRAYKSGGAAKKGYDKPMEYASGGTCRGMGAAKRGGKFTRDG